MAVTRSFAAALPGALDPDADEARRWLLDELSNPRYEAAKPSWWDELVASVFEWFMSLQITGGPVDAILFLIAVLVLAALIAGAIMLFLRPRRRTRTSVTGALFGLDEHRSADELRAAATAAADRGDWSAAIQELFRAVARALEERTVVTVNPGTTAQAFAARAGTAFPAHTEALRDAATAFDDVRYLDRPGSEDAYRAIQQLDRELARATPQLAAIGAMA